MKDKSMRGYRFLRNLLKPIFKFYYNPKILGKENIPIEGSIIICANHIHLMDQCMPIISTKRDIKYMAKKEYWDNKKTKWFFNMAGCIPVDRSKKDDEATKQALDWLGKGGAIGIFPEGTRNKTKAILQPFKFGAVSMAQKTNSLLIPVGIYGEYKFRSDNLTAIIGKPITINENDNLEKVNEDLYDTVLNLIYKAKEESKRN